MERAVLTNWNDIENFSLPGFLLFLTISILLPGSIAIYLGYQVYPFWEGAARCRFEIPGTVQYRSLEMNPETGREALTVEVLYHVGSHRYICSQWSMGRKYLESPEITDSRFYENGAKVLLYYAPDQAELSLLRRYPPKDVLGMTAIVFLLAIPGVFLPLISGSRHWRNQHVFGSLGASFILVWTWGAIGALIWFMPMLIDRVGI